MDGARYGNGLQVMAFPVAGAADGAIAETGKKMTGRGDKKADDRFHGTVLPKGGDLMNPPYGHLARASVIVFTLGEINLTP
jgi:hypothetical protein